MDREVALTLFCTIPSGAEIVVDLRSKIANACLSPPWWAGAGESCGVLIHRYSFDVVEPNFIYIGLGRGKATPPSPYCNPFAALNLSPQESFQKFEYFINARCDFMSWLYPLRGKDMLCDCVLGPWCHGEALRTLCSTYFSDDAICSDPECVSVCSSSSSQCSDCADDGNYSDVNVDAECMLDFSAAYDADDFGKFSSKDGVLCCSASGNDLLGCESTPDSISGALDGNPCNPGMEPQRPR